MKKVVIESFVISAAEAAKLNAVGFAAVDVRGACWLLVEGTQGRFGWRRVNQLEIGTGESFVLRVDAISAALATHLTVYLIESDAGLKEVLDVAQSC